MLLHTLAPSLNFAAAEPPDASSAPARRLTVLLGAGASMYAGAPSTARLTEIIGERSIGGAILQALQSDGREKNFEDVFEALQQLEALEADVPDRPSEALRPFLQLLSEVNGMAIDHESVRQERFAILETIADAFRELRYDESWRTLSDTLSVLLDSFNLDIFTLNYDLLIDVAVEGLSRISGKQWFNGFGSRIRGIDARFDPREYALWNPDWGPKYLTLQHLHGSLRYAYADGARFAHARRFALEEGDADLHEVRQNWARIKDLALRYPDETFCGISPIISGLHKLEKLNVQPYANYYAAFARAISESPFLLIVGYGKGDEHINYWIQEFAQIHNQTARIVEITDNADPNTFAVQRITEWPDLNWRPYKERPEIYESAAGIQNLVLTCGLRQEAGCPALLREFALPLYAR